MPVDMKNHEGYKDPTVHGALSSINQAITHRTYRPLVYICSPYTGDVEHNVRCARKYCRFAVMRERIPIAPHLLYPQFMDDADEDERALGLFMGVILLTKCHELWCFGDTVSAGMAIELERAAKRGMTVRYFTEDCKEVEPCASPKK